MRKILRPWAIAVFVALSFSGGAQAQDSVRDMRMTVLPPRPPVEKVCPAAAREKPFQTGEASHYAEKFNGLRTAFGEIYSALGLTAAHRSLKNGEKILVRNLHNGESVVVRINDRGPFAGTQRGRIIDLSERAAEILGFHGGLGKVALFKCGK